MKKLIFLAIMAICCSSALRADFNAKQACMKIYRACYTATAGVKDKTNQKLLVDACISERITCTSNAS